jgi:transcriptional regulator with XRE-family HTH domain
MVLSEIRQAKEITQKQLAESLHVDQAAISKLEHREDMLLSTLTGVIEALGGKLELRAEFPDGDACSVTLSKKQRVA